MRSKPIFKQKKRPPRANPRRSENPLFMRFIKDYSMIDATLPEPTVLPPSRYLNTMFLHIFYAFGWQNPHKTAVFTQCIFICLSSWHRFGTVGTSSSFTNTNWNFIPRFVCHLSINNSICDHTLFLNTSVQPDKSIILHYFKDNLITVLNVGISTI